MQTNGRRGNCLRGFDLKNCLRGTSISTALWLFSQDNRIRVLQNTMKPVNTDPGEGEGAYEQVLEVGRGDIFLGLVRGEEAQLADHLVAAPQQVDTLPDPFLPSTTTNTPRKRSPNPLGDQEGGGDQEIRDRTWSSEELEAREWSRDALSKRAGSGRSSSSAATAAASRRICDCILFPTSSTPIILAGRGLCVSLPVPERNPSGQGGAESRGREKSRGEG
jgi:hypothetical protein